MIEYAARTYDNELLLDEISGILKEDGRVLFKAKGRSMRPFIRGTIDSVMVERRETFRVGDVVLAKINGNYILHRIFSLDGDKVVLMGDGNVRVKNFVRYLIFVVQSFMFSVLQERELPCPGENCGGYCFL